KVEGQFQRGDVVEVYGTRKRLGKGEVSYSAEEVRNEIIRYKQENESGNDLKYVEVIHRNRWIEISKRKNLSVGMKYIMKIRNIRKTTYLSDAILDRIMLEEERIKGIVEGVNSLMDLVDPVGEVFETVEKENGLLIEKTRVPIGVIGMIYEARPNVTIDAATL